MEEGIGIYDLDQPHYLKEDIQDILDRVEELYEIHFREESTVFVSKTVTTFPFASDESNDAFNKLVPKLKSLVKDMYAVIEGVYTVDGKEFKKLEVEKEYEYLKEFRVFNNKLKHHKNREAEISLTAVVMHDFGFNRIDCNILFWYTVQDKRSVVSIAELVQIFFKILEDKNILEIDRNTNTIDYE